MLYYFIFLPQKQEKDMRHLVIILMTALTVVLFTGCHHHGEKGRPGYVLITSTPIEMAVVDKTYRYQVDACTTLGTALTYTLENGSVDMQLSGTGMLTWTPDNTSVGWNLVTICVSDSVNEKRQHFKINVLPPDGTNHAPFITSAPIETANAGHLYTYDVNATDIDDDAMTFELGYKEHGDAAIVSNTGGMTWTPTAELAGNSFRFIVVVSDNVQENKKFDEQVFTVAVKKKPAGPVFISLPATSAHVNESYSYQIVVEDPDKDALAYLLAAAPPGMLANSTSGLITWTPAQGHLGNNGVILRVTDGKYTAVQNFTVEVLPADALRFTSTPELTAQEGVEWTYLPEVEGVSENATVLFTLEHGPTGMAVDTEDEKTLKWTPTEDDKGNKYAVVFTASDGTWAVRQSFVLTVE
jgi:hypothetical protein